jgi:hypothetical protein
MGALWIASARANDGYGRARTKARVSQNVAAIRRLAISNVPIRGTHNVHPDRQVP